ncbi:ABC transporter permease [Tengunoibacter tsumagoiensis]|uniref:Riboflavin transport system permease protein RibX n=1 Tax=Tengunoibacter tsumagoiensis TaxID=2014871 RepID=A0A402A0X9_9CHLR|nr:ABC transporter permease [Tengunoibacter tsumagoiensis]GCE12709.1 riboflavin transport system permease protein RibX [Tengunoibacter tsumagoiensis]
MSISTSSGKRTGFKLQAYAEPQALQEMPRRRADSQRWKDLQHLISFLPPFLLALLFIMGWYFITASGRINSLILPTPAEVLASFSDGVQSGLFWSNLQVTLQESLLGFLLAVAIALPIGYGVAKSRLLARTLLPYLAAGQAIPAIVIAPFLFLWFGNGLLPVVIVCMLVVLFPLVMNTILGVQTIDPALTDAARLEGAAGWSLLSKIEFPLALPAILAAVRTGMTLSITGALVGEFFCSPDRGLGALVQIALHQYDMSLMFATVLVLAVLAALYYSATWLLVKAAESTY